MNYSMSILIRENIYHLLKSGNGAEVFRYARDIQNFLDSTYLGRMRVY